MITFEPVFQYLVVIEGGRVSDRERLASNIALARRLLTLNTHPFIVLFVSTSEVCEDFRRYFVTIHLSKGMAGQYQ